MNSMSLEEFAGQFAAIQKSVHQTAIEKGWWGDPSSPTERNLGEALALVHSELSEAVDALVNGNPPDDKIPEFTGIEAEIGDAIIRIMDLAEFKGWRVAEAMQHMLHVFDFSTRFTLGNSLGSFSVLHVWVSHALEALREGNPRDEPHPFNKVETRLAAFVLDAMDYAAFNGWRVPEAIIAKSVYKTPPARTSTAARRSDMGAGINPKELAGQDRLSLSLIPSPALAHMALALTEGAEKYGPFNWRETSVQGMTYVDAVWRHLTKWVNGENKDPDTDVHHLASCLASLAILMDAIEIGNWADNRPPPAPGYSEQLADMAAQGVWLRKKLKRDVSDSIPSHIVGP